MSPRSSASRSSASSSKTITPAPDLPSTPSGSLATVLPTKSSPGLERLTAKLNDVRSSLIENAEKSWYLGEDTGRERVLWHRIGKGQMLLTKEGVAALEAAQDKARTKQTSSEDDDTASESARIEPEPALLSAVVSITQDDFWMMSWGRWKGPTSVCPQFSDMKLSCTGVALDDNVFRSDFPKVISNIHHLMNTSATKGVNLKKGVLVSSNESQKIKFRHALFEPLSGESDAEGEEANGDNLDDIPDAFRIQNWPTVYDEAKYALQEMITTHRVAPIPAYDLRGNLILPNQYRRQLEGATVQIHFMLQHWTIGGRAGAAITDTYVADIVSMRVLVPPRAQTSPLKRKLFVTDPMSSPSKKNQV